MFDMNIEDEHLVYGAILEGSQKPSEILDAMLPYLEWAAHKTAEWGGDFIEANVPFLQAEALRKLALSSSHYDVCLDVDDEFGVEEITTLTMHHMVHELIAYLDGFTEIGRRFGFSQGDLGVWTDWAFLDRILDSGECVRVYHPDDLPALDGPARFALLETEEVLTLFAVSGEVIWSIE